MIDFSELNISQQDEINQICADFKRHWQAERSPAPDQYLARVGPNLRALLVQLLQEIEQEYRGSAWLGSRYRVLDRIGHGGMGEVFRVEDNNLNRSLAVKVLLPKHKGRPAAVERFIQEAHVTGQLQHPGIPPIHELGQLLDGRPYLAMKLIRGRTLDELPEEGREARGES